MEFNDIKIKLNVWNNKFFENWGDAIAHILVGIASPEEKAVVSSGILYEQFKGWNFALPSDQECRDWLAKDAKPILHFVEWSEDDGDENEIKEWDFDIRNIEKIPETIKRFIMDISEVLPETVNSAPALPVTTLADGCYQYMFL